MLRTFQALTLAALTGAGGSSTLSAQERGTPVPAFPDSLNCLLQTPRPVNADVRDTTSRPVGAPAPQAARQRPTVILMAEAHAREVRFASQPRLSVRLCGALGDSVRVLERRNLPERIQPGMTYRDVYVAVEILGHLNAECIIDRLQGRGSGNTNRCAALQLRDSSATSRP